ncbi:hypothetical protein [Desulfoscipio gibsoniae]|uniref:Uncharacterized protein n=1 Tax=Desulfoscipio gibsoniae DSM 7213 TaxID=767817 RepID=R4KPL7_9FIRM|nr:hypothetical protein [Desulfoscipio gibsoniae]AGL01591.1 hypothetical protein Desgi_2158 [Desulfoscipio gibsoniae DSM 7213]
MSKTFLPMMLTVFASMGTYYLLATEVGLEEYLSMTGGIAVGVLGAVATSKILRRR